MIHELDPAARPSRLPIVAHSCVVFFCLASFASGGLIWVGQIQQARTLETPSWLHAALITHGALYPVMCILFGYLVCQHIRIGWELRANLVSGVLMEVVFAGLIVSGAGLYYASEESARHSLVIAHRVMGLALPVSLGAHWYGARRWARLVEGNKR